jgi:HK97 family phage portal protein
MSFLDAMKGTLGAERSISFQDIWSQGLDLTLSGQNQAGVKVNSTTASGLSAVYASWRIISEGVSTLPRDSMRRMDGLPKPFRPRPVWLDYPNRWDTWIEFMGQVSVSLLADGNAYVLVSWTDGAVEDLIVLDPTMVTVQERGLYTLQGSGATVQGVSKFTGRAPVEILHLRGMTLPGALTGMSPIQATAETLGISLAAQRYGSSFFNNDGTPGGIIEVPDTTKLSPVGQDALRTSWKELYGGPNRAKSVAVLVEGAKFKTLQVSPNEAQFLETRKFGVQEVARIYGIPPHLISDTTNTTGWGTGMAEQNTAYVTHTLRPWIERIEAGLTMLVQLEVEAAKVSPSPSQAYINLEEEALLRGATTERWDNHRKNVGSGLWTADEARKSEGLPPLPDDLGAVPWIPLAQAPQEEEPEAEEVPTEIVADDAPEGDSDGE